MKKIRWGILGTGYIANLFAEGLQVVNDAELVAVGSRSQESANGFGEKWNIPHKHASYEALANDPDVDVVYVGTPHPMHRDNTILCLNAGKHALVEKSFAVNENQAKEMVDLARKKGLFLMEAMWTRYIPAIVQVRKWISEGAIGEVQQVRADLSFVKQYDREHRLFSPELGGGALLDVGVYPVSLASMVLGAPKQVCATANLGPTGVDWGFSCMLGYEDGKASLLSGSVGRSVPVEAMIVGTKGYISIPQPWFTPRSVTLWKNPNPEADVDLLTFIAQGNIYNTTTLRFPVEGNAYNYEAVEVGECIRNGKLESETMPLDETLNIMRVMDLIRHQCGITYPSE